MNKIMKDYQAQSSNNTLNVSDTSKPADTAIPTISDDTQSEQLTVKKKYTEKSVIRIKFTPDQKRDIIDIIKKETAKQESEYDEQEYHEKNQLAQDDLEGKKVPTDFPVKGAANKKLMLLKIMADIVAGKHRRQTYGANPICILEREDEIADNDLQDWMDLIDFRMRKDIKGEQQTYHAAMHAYYQGAAVYRGKMAHDTEPYVHYVTYSKDNQSDFDNKYRDQMIDTGSKARAISDRIANGETVTVEECDWVVVKHCPDTYRIPLDKFHARLSIKDMSKQIAISEEREYKWHEIEQMRDENFYDDDAVTELMNKNKEAGIEYQTEPFNIWISEVLCALKNDKGETKLRRYMVEYDTKTDIILRSIYYPYRNNKMDIVVYNAFPKDDSWMGWRAADTIRDIVGIAQNFLNAILNEFTLAHTPVLVVDDTEIEAFTRKEIVGSNISVLPIPKGSKAQPIKFDYAPMDRVGILQWCIQFSELISGVNASLMSGNETPLDPQAPAAKTAMQSAASNMRIEDIILNLQKGDVELWELLDCIYAQYTLDDGQTEYKYYPVSGTQKTINATIFTKKVNYIAHGSRLPFDKRADLALTMQGIDYLNAISPLIKADVEVQYVLAEAIINDTGGSLEKNRDVILKPIKMVRDMKKELKPELEQRINGAGMPGMGGSVPGQLKGAGMPQQQPAMPQLPGGQG